VHVTGRGWMDRCAWPVVGGVRHVHGEGSGAQVELAGACCLARLGREGERPLTNNARKKGSK
jgi:hypothetical protein